MRCKMQLCVLCAAVIACLGAAGVATATSIGPDAAGYVAFNDTFAWEDISGTGTRVLDGTDDSTVNAPLGFTFDFYGASNTDVWLSTNGLMTFGAPNNQFANVDLTSSAPDVDVPSVAALWDDWVTFNGGDDAVYYETLGAPGAQRFIAQWNLVEHYSSSPSTVTFEAQLFEGSNDILFQYQDVIAGDGFSDNGAGATVGIRDAAGQTNGRVLQWEVNGTGPGGLITDGEAIRMTTKATPELPSSALLLLSMAPLGWRCWRRKRA